VLVLDRTVWLTTYGLTLIYAGSACLLCGVLGRPPRTTALVRGLSTVGYYSYSVYLWHMPVKDWFAPLFRIGLGIPKTYLTEAATYFTLSIVLGIVMAKLVEFPMLKLRDRWFPSPTATPVTEPVTPLPAALQATSAPV
jgi:peptidoglycan/LPS O-acetylase OafA/YrhL